MDLRELLRRTLILFSLLLPAVVAVSLGLLDPVKHADRYFFVVAVSVSMASTARVFLYPNRESSSVDLSYLRTYGVSGLIDIGFLFVQPDVALILIQVHYGLFLSYATYKENPTPPAVEPV